MAARIGFDRAAWVRVILTAVLLLLIGGRGRPVNAADVRPPDLLVFICDDLGRLDISPYGCKEIRTPNMQRLADAGMTFERAYVASPSCAPSRASLLTGLMPARNGAEPNHSRPRAELKKWPAYFQELGYEVVAFGKVSHYKHTAQYGFDHFEHDGFHDDVAIPAAVEYLKKRGKSDADPRLKPLCLMVGTNWPHVPWPEKHPGYSPSMLPLPSGSVDTAATREWRARYAAAVSKADADLGLTLDAAQTHLGKNTIVLFSSDHGAQWPFGKWNCYESGVAVPLIVVWPGVIKGGTRSDAMVSWIDFLPTLLDAVGGNPPKSPEPIDGRSFAPILRGVKTSHRERIFTTHSGDGRWNVYPMRAVRDERWKYIRNLHPEFAFTTHIDLPNRAGDRTYFASWEEEARRNPDAAAILKRYHARPAEELYDLATDPQEQHNLAADPGHAARKSALRAELDAWMKEQGDQQRVFAVPRLLTEPDSFGPHALPGDVPAKNARKPATAKKEQT